ERHRDARRLFDDQDVEATRQNLLRRETDWIRRGPPARTTKSKSRIARYEALVASAPDQASGELSFEIPCSERLGTKVLALRQICKAYGERTILHDFDLELQKGERLGIVGPNGAGKSTMTKIALGRVTPDSGSVEVGATVRYSFLDQERAQLDPEHTIVQAVAGANDYVYYDGRPMRIESYLESFLFTGGHMHAKVGSLSGGERNRVLLAKLLAIGGNVLVFDEPTNDLDLTTLRVLEEALCAFEGSALIVSHDRWFLDRVATRCVYIGDDGTHRFHAGDASQLLDLVREDKRVAREAEARLRSKEVARVERPKARSLSKERKEAADLPARIEALEARLVSLDQELADPSLYEAGSTKATRLAELVRTRDALQRDIGAAYARWEELETLLANGDA
nr:ATP-binding cassette domain-containing protein [Planctomycetota bacterium]